MTWRLRLVGSPVAWRDDDSVPLPLERRWQLVVFLALRGDWVQRAEVAALLWPELPRALASANLRKALFRLRDTPLNGAIEADGDMLRAAIATDVAGFASQVREGRIAEALASHRGELLAGFDDDANENWTDWLRAQRDHWRDGWRAAALRRLSEPVDSGEGLALSTAMLEADPLDEAALEAQLGHLARMGQVARAREIYRSFAGRLEQELGVQPGRALRAAHDGLQARPLAPAPPENADDGYVGRVLEKRRILELMARPDCRLLAVVGPGGVGKTRLVRHALADVATLFADGSTFVSLEGVDSPGAFVSRVARSLGIGRDRESDEFDAVAGYLGVRHSLLVLDNFEPVAATATLLLAQWLERAPRLKLIVTTRERLALGAQWALPIDGLPCPGPEDADRLEDFDASCLFLAAARRANPAVDPGSEPAAIVDICRQVDGLPLALEIAAAWTHVMRCEEIARELRQGTELFRASNPAFPARQASLEAVFEQSWRLIGESERQALARMSVFRGGFTVEGARAVALAPLPVQGALADKSLLRKDGARMGLHALVQRFAALRLGDGAALAAARTAHARFFRNLLSECESGLRQADAAALRLVDDEFENCVEAFHWLAAHGPATDLLTASTALADHARHRGRAKSCLEIMQAALAGPVGSREAGLRARLLAHAANQHFRLDRFADADETAREALSLAEHDKDGVRETRRLALNALGSVALWRGHLAEAREHYSAMSRLAGKSAPLRPRATTAANLALIEGRLGRLDEALRLSHESLALRRRLGDAGALALGLNNLASLLLTRREIDAAAPVLDEAQALCEKGGFNATYSIVMINQCELALARGDPAAAERHGARALQLGQSNGQRMVVGMAHARLGTASLRRGDVAAARASITVACEIAMALEVPSLKSVSAAAFARLLHAGGQRRAAQRVLQLAAADPGLDVPDRMELDRLMADWGGDPPAVLPDLTLDALLQRVAIEGPSGHAALIAFLDG